MFVGASEYWNNDELRKYTLLFGTLFKDIKLQRTNTTDSQVQFETVPIAYGGRDKYIGRELQDPGSGAPSTPGADRPVAAQLPRMAFEMLAVAYDPARQLNTLNQIITFTSPTNITTQYVPVPWNIGYNLYITARNVEDASKIVQQILPFFTPMFNIQADIVGSDEPKSIQIVLNNVAMSDNYEGSMLDRRILVWTLSFTLKGWFYGPQSSANGIIRWVDVNYHTDTAANTPVAVSTNTYPTLANTAIDNIMPTDPYIINTSITDLFDDS